MIRVQKKTLFFAFIFLGMSILNLSVEAADVPKGLPRPGDIIPAFSIPVPINKADRSYLMLEESGIFQPAEMNIKLLILEVLNVY